MLYVFDDYTLDPMHYELHHKGKLVRLEPRVFKLLAYLVQHPGHTVPTKALLELLYPQEFVPVERLNNAVARVRRALGEKGQSPQYIQTVHRLGYRFIAPVEIRQHIETDARRPTAPDTPIPAEQHGVDPIAAVLLPPPIEAPSAATRGMPDEWRQLTVLACQLVGVSGPATPLEREARLEVVRDYQAVCTAVIQRFDGYIAQYQVEQLLVYFGYPRAHEDDARRAVHTGLGIVAGITEHNRHRKHESGVQLAVQVGIHTGVELVGAVGCGDQHVPLAVGETPTIAARLQNLATPDTVVISPATWRLVEGYFVCEALGAHGLEDYSPPLVGYRVLQESPAQSRLDVAITQGLTPFVGRAREVELLLDRWEQAKEGMGQVVVLSGEAGIGKSRLVQVFKEAVAQTAHAWVEFHCSPYYQHTALYPVVTYLQRFLHFSRGETAEERLHKLKRMLERYGFALEEVVPLFAVLLSMPPPACYPPLTLPPELQRQKMLEALLMWLLKQAEQQPVCVILEDLHWGDASSLEWLSLLIDQLPTARLLLFLLFRPDFRPPWVVYSHLTHLALTHLSPRQTEEMIGQVAGGKLLPAGMLQQIVTKTDGVPLFVEEVTKMVLESGLLREVHDHYELTGPLPVLAIPTTLQDTLMTRLDRLESAKSVVQLGATLGRTFTYTLLQALSPLDDETLQRDLGRLVEAKLLYQRGVPPQATYLFKHALIQETAYQSLLKSTRQQYHERIVQVLTTHFPETVELQPELLAHHYTEAGLIEHAIPHWQRAGQRAGQRSAHVEAVSHLTKGLDLLQLLPDTPERTRHELTLCLALGVSLAATRGYATLEVAQAYTRARMLCQQVGDTPELFLTLRGLELFYLMRGEVRTARELGEQLLSLASRQAEPARQVAAHMALGQVLFVQGDLAAAREHLAQGLALYDSQQLHYLAWPGGQPGVGCSAFLALVLWLLGYPDQALTWSRTALTWAQQLSHPLSLALALAHTVILYHFRREGPAVQPRIEALVTLSTEQRFALFTAVGTMAQGWALIEQGQEKEGLAQMRQGLEAFRATEIAAFLPYVYIASAEVYGKVRQPDEGLCLIADALALVANNKERFYEAELYRLQGELLLARPTDAEAEAIACFHQALTIARQQHAKSLELRAAMSLARLWQRQDKRREARQLLAAVYAWFTEGFDTADLQEAKALLEELT
jgi:class 3 adenylate cyclase/DNA-binding winged helix-turn-helix (wHTH) protein/predicted ATPase